MLSSSNPTRLPSPCWGWMYTGRARSVIASGMWIRTSPSAFNSVSPESARARPAYDTSMSVPRICRSCHVSRQGPDCLRRGYERPDSSSDIRVDECKPSARSAASNANAPDSPLPRSHNQVNAGRVDQVYTWRHGRVNPCIGDGGRLNWWQVMVQSCTAAFFEHLLWTQSRPTCIGGCHDSVRRRTGTGTFRS